MPAKSKSQQRLMQAVAHNPAFAKKVGISQKVGKEFVGMAGGGGIPKVEDALKRATEEKPAPPPPPSNQDKFFTGPKQTASERDKGLAAALKKRGYAAGGSIDGCATRGKTRAGRR